MSGRVKSRRVRSRALRSESVCATCTLPSRTSADRLAWPLCFISAPSNSEFVTRGEMDDTLEMPTATPKPDVPQEREEDEHSSGDEDQGPDWTKIPYARYTCFSL